MINRLHCILTTDNKVTYVNTATDLQRSWVFRNLRISQVMPTRKYQPFFHGEEQS